MKNKFNTKPKVIRSDQGEKYLNHKLIKFLKEEGIVIQLSAPFSLQQNGKAERKNKYFGIEVELEFKSSESSCITNEIEEDENARAIEYIHVQEPRRFNRTNTASVQTRTIRKNCNN